MSFGKMNTTIQICEERNVKDNEGFSSTQVITLKTVHAYREGRHGSLKWANMSAFSDVTDLFKFRVIPDLEIKTSMFILCNNRRFKILSAQDIKGKGMYIEIMAREVDSSGKSQV